MNESRIGPEAVPVRTAARLLGYASRSTIYSRINSGHLIASVDTRGRMTVTTASIQAYLSEPPAGSWSRTPPPDPESRPSEPPQDADEIAALRAENLKLRETVSRLQMVREKEAAARDAEREANRHLHKALKQHRRAGRLSSSALSDMDELVTLFLTPDNLGGAD